MEIKPSRSRLHLRIDAILVMIIIILAILWINSKLADDDEPQGWIVYRALRRAKLDDPYPRDLEYYIMDGNGNRTQWIGEYRGAPVWSPDGRYIAVSCEEDVYQLCIIKVDSIPDLRTWPFPDFPYTEIIPDIKDSLKLPDECEGLVSEENGLESISWSPDGGRIAVVCGDSDYDPRIASFRRTPRIVCILEVNTGVSDCWENFPISVYKADWSPTENLLAVSKIPTYSKELKGYEEYAIYLVAPDGQSPQYLANGIAPAWSPDGNEVAFMTEQTNEQGEVVGSGIAAIRKDGTGFRWLMKNPEDGSYNFRMDCNNGCKLVWSSDGNYIAFQGEMIEGNLNIFRLNVETGEIICLLCYDPNQFVSLPDWGPPIEGW